MSDQYYSGPTSPPYAAAPPPPPKPYSQSTSRSGTPQNLATPAQQQAQRYSQHYPQSPAPPVAVGQQPFSAPLQQVSYQASPRPNISSQSPQYFPTPAFPQQSQPENSQTPNSFELPELLVKQTTSDLSKLLSSSELLNAVAQGHPAYSAAIAPLQNQITSNINLAGQVAALETQLRKLREETGQLMLQHSSLQTQWRRKQTEMDEALAPWGPRAMYQRLLASISEQEALLTAVQESFLEGNHQGHDFYGSADAKASEKEVTDWVKRIREGAATLEKRREMRARWDEGRVGGWR